MPQHLTYLTERFRTAGGTLEVSPVASLSDVTSQAPAIVNCTGLGARTLLGDNQLYPIRGHRVILANPGFTDFLEVDTGDSPELIAIYPYQTHVVLGGTAEPEREDEEPGDAEAQAIIARCTAIEPRLTDANILEHRIGFRPTRPEIRLDSHLLEHGTRLVNNYGHGGAGVSLSCGCAANVAALL